MFSLLIAMALQTTMELNEQEMAVYRTNLSSSAREELDLVDRMRSLRISIEKLPDTWRGIDIKLQTENLSLDKQGLLTEVENMELASAERWSIILNNTAYLDRLSEPKAFEARRELQDLPKVQMNLRKRIDDIKFKLIDAHSAALALQLLPN